MRNRADDELGIPEGTAYNRLRKMVLFQLIRRSGLNVCHQCGEPIEFLNELTIEHKVPWRGSDEPYDLFFDLDNIAFSHWSCNSRAARKGKV